MKRNIKKILSLLLALVIVFVTGTGVVLAGDKDTVKIGYIDYNNFIQDDGKGSYSGYAVDYLNEISKYTHWNYEYVYGDWSELLEKLKNKEIDFVCSAQITNERQKIYDYSKYALGYTQGLLYTRINNNDIYYNDFSALNGKKIGTMAGNAMIEYYEKFEKENNFSTEVIDYKNEEELVKALNNKEIDAIASEHLSLHTNLKLVANFGSDAYYMMSYKNGPYIDDLNYALSEINKEPSFAADLYDKYYSESSAEADAHLTREETQFIDNLNKSNKKIDIYLIPNRSPISFVDSSGNVDGIVKDILNLVTEETNLPFDYKMMPSGVATADFLQENPDAIIAGVLSDNKTFQSDGYALSSTFYSENIIFVCKQERSFDFTSKDKKYKIAVPKSYVGLKAYTQKEYPFYEIITYNTTEECLKAVKSGEVDLFAQNKDVVTPFLQNPHYEDLIALPSIFMDEKLSAVGNNNDQNALIISIMNKSIATFTDKDINQITINNTISNAYTPTFFDTLYKYRIATSIAIVLIVVCFGLLIVISIIRQKNIVKINEKNSQLALAIDQANRANEAKSDFLSRMSHEIRTPMNAIVGITEIAKTHGGDTEKIMGYLDKIDVSSKVLLNLINDILDMSAIEGAKLKIANNLFDFKSLISSIATVYYEQCEEKGITFNVIIENVVSEELIGDSMRLNQILLNLISNAYKFTDAGGKVVVKISETSKNDKEVFLRFIVSDTGCGMTEEIQKKLFDPFEQESVLTARKYGGSGLGMSITKNLIDLMHGAINVESEKGIGTTITVDIPFGYKHSDDFKSITADDFKLIKALIIDDDPNEREYTEIMLERMGVSHKSVSSGEEAIAILEKTKKNGKHFDICLVDWKMSEKVSGIDVTKKINKLFGDETVVVIVSAYDMSEVEDEAKKAGANMFITKPIFQSTVFNIFMNLSGNKHTAEKAPKSSYDFSGKRILLAEDNKLNQEIAVDLLSMVGFELDCADDGKEAYDTFCASKEGTYDVILMDIQMPVWDGYEASKRIRKANHPQAKTIPIFAMTANAFSEDVANAYSSGMNGHISKPINTKILYDTLDKALNKKD